jgi:hypothetical protein
MRALLIAAAITVGTGMHGAHACSLPGERLSGESEAEAYDRFHRQHQDRLWAQADVVFVGEVVRLTKSGDTFDVEVLPRGALKGEIGTAPITYLLDYDGLACDAHGFPAMTFPGVFYASRTPDGALRVDGMLNSEDIRDDALRDRLYGQLGMEPIPRARLDEADRPPVLPHWVWLVGTASVALLAGVLIGRSGHTASNKQKPRS